VKLAAYGICLFILVLPFAARASEDLVAKREACRVESRSRILLKGKIEVDEYRRIVERRAAYVAQCLNRTVVARSDAPLPPQRVLNDAMESPGPSLVASSRNEPRRLAERAKPHKFKAAKLRGGKPGISSRRRR